MEKSIVVHRLLLDMSSQAVQATITLAQHDQATHRLIVTLRHGAEVVELPPGSYAIAVQNAEAEVDVLDTVTVYGADSAMPNCIVYDVTAAVTEKEGYHEAQFLISRVDESGSLRSLSSPRIAFVVKPDILRSSDVQKSSSYDAVVEAAAAAVAAQEAAEAAYEDAKAVGAVSDVAITGEGTLMFTFEDGRQIETVEKVPVCVPGRDGVSPTVLTERVEGGYRITVTAANGVSTFILPDGAKGATGDPFRIAKTYTSVAAMHAGFADDNVPKGGFVLIAAGSVEDADNAKLFVKGTEYYQYLIDLSGATGIRGPAGSSIKSIAKTGTSGLVDTYTVTLTDGSTYTYTVTNGKDGADGVSPTVSVTETGTGHTVHITDVNGTKSFIVRDGEDCGSSGSAEVLRNTVLLKARLGHHFDGSSATPYLVTSAVLADEILPNTTYFINGEAHTSDADGVISGSFSYGGYLEYTLALSGRAVTMEIIRDSGEYVDLDLEVVGPGAFTCLAYLQLNSDQGSDGPNHYHAEPLTVQPVAYRNVYVYSTAYQTVVQTIVLDENGTFPETHILTDPACGSVRLALQNGLAEMTFSSFEGHSDGAICLLTEVDGVTNLSGGTSSGGGSSGGATAIYRFDYYSNNNSDYYIPLDPAKIYLITCFESGSYERQLVIERGIVRADYGSCDSIMTCEYYAYSDQLYVTCYGSSLVAVQEIAEYTETTCFMPGTKILLRDPATKELYEKPIEQVQPFEYAAFWHPGKGRLSATRIVAPPIVGECTEYDRLTFSNGTTVDVYGVQFFWNVDTDRLQNWASMKPGTRVCTSEGDIVEYVGHEHIVSDLPVKHYTLLPFMGRYIANGIQVGDKRELILPRLLQPENKRYWRMLPERDQENLKRAFGSGTKRRNWRYSKEVMEVRQRFRHQREALEGEEKTAQAYLDYTDHEVTKLAEGVITEGEFEPVREERAAARVKVKQCRAELAELQPAEEAEIEAVRVAIANTYAPRHAGKFKGKTRCVLEEESK